MDYRRGGGGTHSPVTINGTGVERVDNFKYLGVNLHKDQTWASHCRFKGPTSVRPQVPKEIWPEVLNPHGCLP